MKDGVSRDLNALLGSRICHDLISPLGAIGNGVELLTLSGIGAAPEISLIAESVSSANARIRFFRIAFGATGEGHAVPLAEVKGILTEMSRGGRLSYRWLPETELERTRVKLAFLILQCIESAMPWGGDIRVTDTSGVWTIHGTAERLKLEPELWELLVDPASPLEISPSQVHFALVSEAARRAGRIVTTDLRETAITVSF